MPIDFILYSSYVAMLVESMDSPYWKGHWQIYRLMVEMSKSISKLPVRRQPFRSETMSDFSKGVPSETVETSLHIRRAVAIPTGIVF